MGTIQVLRSNSKCSIFSVQFILIFVFRKVCDKGVLFTPDLQDTSREKMFPLAACETKNVHTTAVAHVFMHLKDSGKHSHITPELTGLRH